MERYYVHKFCLDDTLLVDTVNKTWVFYNTNMWNQFYNLEEQPKKITNQRIRGLLKRLNSSNRYYRSEGFVVDPFIYHYIFTDEQRQEAKIYLDFPKDLIASGDDLKEVLTTMCEYTLNQSNIISEKHRDYYQQKIEALVASN